MCLLRHHSVRFPSTNSCQHINRSPMPFPFFCRASHLFPQENFVNAFLMLVLLRVVCLMCIRFSFRNHVPSNIGNVVVMIVCSNRECCLQALRPTGIDIVANVRTPNIVSTYKLIVQSLAMYSSSSIDSVRYGSILAVMFQLIGGSELNHYNQPP